MLTILPKRPASPPSLMSPSKRAKTPSPQKDLVKGVFSPTIPSSFRAKLEAIRLRPTTTTAPVYPIIRFHEGTADGRIPQVSGEKDCKDMPITVSGSLCVMYRSSVEAVSDIAAAVPEPNEKNPRKQLDFNSAASSASSIPKSLVIPSIIEMGFSLVSPGYVQRSPTKNEVAIMRGLFPDVRRVLHMPPYLTLVCETLPEIRPHLIAGIPCHFTTEPNGIPMQGEWCRGPPLELGIPTPLWKLPSLDTRKEIIKNLAPHGVRSIGWMGTRWLLEVENPDSSTKAVLPRTINGLVSSFRPFKRPEPHSLTRSKIPSSLQIDNTNYHPRLHAGMLVTDGDSPTTSGVPISSVHDSSKRYFTIASHGFVTGAEVIHPLPPPLGRVIGVADVKFGESDISLCRITDDALQYSAETFAGTSGSIRLTNLVKEENCYIGKELFLDSPFTGLGTGIVTVHGLDLMPPYGPDEQWNYVANIWVNFESGLEDPKKGCCGSPLFDGDGNVYAFFRYFTQDGSCTSYCPCPDPL